MGGSIPGNIRLFSPQKKKMVMFTDYPEKQIMTMIFLLKNSSAS